MANKTIPELPEIDLVDLTDDQLFILETAVETHKLRMSTLRQFFTAIRTPLEVVFDGEESGEFEVDVTDFTPDATLMIWMLRDSSGKQMPAIDITATDDATITIDTGEFALPAGTYTILGV